MIMPSEEFHEKLSWGLLLASPPLFLLLLKTFGKVPNYGKHSLPGRMLSVNARLSWFLFESPNIVWCIYSFSRRDEQVFSASPANAILLATFVLHYINRSIVYPFRMSKNSKPVNIVIFALAFSFCFVNGYLQSQYFCQFHTYPSSYCKAPNFIIGIAMCITGFIINVHSDAILRQLRNTPPIDGNISTYKIPTGGLFQYVSCANFFGEIVEWFGYAIAAGKSLPAWAFVAWVCANLIPRAISHHEWYHTKFEDYPKERFAVIPFVI